MPPRPSIDERTLAGYLIGPTEERAREIESSSDDPLIRYADIEEHVVDPQTRGTRRCDLTLRSADRALVSAEMKRPEVMGVRDQRLLKDAWGKAVSRGMDYFLTCNMREVAVWETRLGPAQRDPKLCCQLAPGLTHSYFARDRRPEIARNWRAFLDQVGPLLGEQIAKGTARARPLPPQAVELRDAIRRAAEEAARRIRVAAGNGKFRKKVLAEFRDQFGVELHLDPDGNADAFILESEQVATIAGFVVATRLLLYQALSAATRTDGTGFDLDPLDITRSTTDPRRVEQELAALFEHARHRTEDFETTLTPSVLDDIVFVGASRGTDVGLRWGAVIDVVKGADWSGPAAYVPGLYESLLEDEHRHVMGVHYTADTVAEIITAYAIRGPTDLVLDPAAGAGTFITMAYERKRALGSTHEQSLEETYGVEIADFAASLSSLGLTLADPNVRSAYPRVIKADFFHTEPGKMTNLKLPGPGRVTVPTQFDAIIGNPPYVRFENRTPEERLEIFELLAQQYLNGKVSYPDFTGKADLWAFFVAHAHSFLKDGGRLGFVLSWNLLATSYGDAVLSFLGRNFYVDAIIDSKVERWFAAKQNTLLLLARRAPAPPSYRSSLPNPNIDPDHRIRFVRLKQPLERLLDHEQPRGKRAEDLVEELLATPADTGDDLRWDVRLVPQAALIVRTNEIDTGEPGEEDNVAE